MKHRRVKLALLPALLLMLIAAAGPIGCAQDEPNGASGAITITDSLGKTLEFESPVDTIISLAPSNTEIVFAVGAGDKLIGRTDYCNFPSEAESVESVGGFSTPDK